MIRKQQFRMFPKFTSLNLGPYYDGEAQAEWAPSYTLNISIPSTLPRLRGLGSYSFWKAYAFPSDVKMPFLYFIPLPALIRAF